MAAKTWLRPWRFAGRAFAVVAASVLVADVLASSARAQGTVKWVIKGLDSVVYRQASGGGEGCCAGLGVELVQVAVRGKEQ